jgi:hypothetical protein
MTKYWFKPKRYGYGFYPVSWEGWLATLGLVFIILLSGCSNNFFIEPGPTKEQSIRFFLDIVIIASLATLLFEKKMQETLKWRWGKRK